MRCRGCLKSTFIGGIGILACPILAKNDKQECLSHHVFFFLDNLPYPANISWIPSFVGMTITEGLVFTQSLCVGTLAMRSAQTRMMKCVLPRGAWERDTCPGFRAPDDLFPRFSSIGGKVRGNCGHTLRASKNREARGSEIYPLFNSHRQQKTSEKTTCNSVH